MVHLDELRAILLSERESGRLVPVPPDLYAQAAEEIARITREAHSFEDPFGDDAQLLIQKIGSLKETVADLYRIRSAKIVGIAIAQADGHPGEREDMKRMVAGERAMCEGVTGVLRDCHDSLLRAARGGKHVEDRPMPAAGAESPGGEGGGEIIIPAGPESPFVPQDTGPSSMTIRVLADIEPFIGVDGRVYHLSREDIVTLPERNAAVLCERRISIPVLEPFKPRLPADAPSTGR